MKRDPSKFFSKIVYSCRNIEQLDVAENMIHNCPELYYKDDEIAAYFRLEQYKHVVNEMKEYLKRSKK